MNKRRGLTLIELLTVVAVIGLLVALLLPAVQAAREAARSVRCKNNLRQIGLALHAYHERCHSFPPASVVDWSRTEPTGWWSWIVRILPDLEEQALYDQFDMRDDVWANSAKYKQYTSTQLAVLLCPSDPNGERVYRSDAASAFDDAFALTNYLGCRGSTRQGLGPDGFYPNRMPGNGVFPDVNEVARFAQIVDGATQTILVGERPADPEAYWGWWAAGRGFDDHGLGDYVLDLSEGLHEGARSGSADLLHYWSAHRGGANFAMCDGSVRVLSYAIEHSTFLALGSRNGGEIVSGF
jgi:prepilin-type N-terminal cleavage/methylation domain-containing protein/prepilin-type processing-associated H-X9-DG protein